MRRMMFDRVQHVPELPDRREWELEDGVLYIADDEPYAAWLCPCGCGRIVVVSVEHENSTHPTWHIEEKDGKGDMVCAKLRVSELIRAKPGIGRARCERIMDDLAIARTRCVGGLGPRQVERLAQIL